MTSSRLPALFFLPALLAACGAPERGASSTSSGGATSSSPVHAAPPGPGPGGPPDGSGHVTFAVSRLHLGDADRDATPDKGAWAHYGFDLDGKISTAASTDLCQLRDGAQAAAVYPDGDDGADNAFGRGALPLFLGLSTTLPADADAALAAGTRTLLFDLDALGDAADYAPVVARAYSGAALGHAPAFDGADAWPMAPESLADPADLGSATARTASSYVVSDTWVARFDGVLTLELPVGGSVYRLPVQHPVVSMTLDPQHRHASNGTLAGVIDAASWITGLKQTTETDPCSCTSACFSSIFDVLVRAADILDDGTQDRTQPCTGISIGIGFEAERVTLGAVAPPAPPPTNPCQPGP